MHHVKSILSNSVNNKKLKKSKDYPIPHHQFIEHQSSLSLFLYLFINKIEKGKKLCVPMLWKGSGGDFCYTNFGNRLSLLTKNV
jgi:hypothetical protein